MSRRRGRKGRQPIKEFPGMGAFTIWHWLIVLVVVALVFGGRGKLSGIMGDAAKGIRAFREGLKGEEEAHEEPPAPQPLPKTRAKTKTNG
jgi:sec-independent protein translocase protein TatA